ncbi:MAG: NMD3-related protein [Candidatus Woesearchaeota archaeon]
MHRFCPKCGETIERGTFCEECNPKQLEFKQIKMKLCPTHKYFHKGTWAPFDDIKLTTKTVIEKTLKKKIKLIQGLEEYPDLLLKTGIKKEFDTIVEIEGERYTLPVLVEVTTSPSFAKVGTSYFEGILQLRDATKEIKDYIIDELDSNEIYVNKVDDKGDSVDYYFVKKRYITRIAEKLITKYGGYMDANAQLFTQDSQTSKELYRLNVVVYIPPFTRGDVIIKKDELILITSIGKTITGHEYKSGKNINFKYNPKEKHEYKQAEKQKTKIITVHPEIQALSNKTYEVITIENPKQIHTEKNQTITIVEHEGRAYLVK